MEQHLQTIGVNSINQFKELGAIAITKKLLLTGTIDPHIMYFHALVAAEQDRGIFSFDRAEKSELKIEYADIMDEVG